MTHGTLLPDLSCRVPSTSPVPAAGPLSDHHLYSCPRWLHMLAAGGRPATAYLTAGGRGLLPVYRGLPTGNAHYANATLFRDLPGPRPSEVLRYGGALSAYQAEIPTLRDGRPDDLTALVEEAESWSGGSDRLLLPYLTDRSAADLPARFADRLVLETLEAWSPAGVRTLPDLLAAMPRKQRLNARRNLRDFDRSGLTAGAEPLNTCIPQFASLAGAASRKHGQQDEPAALRRHLEAIAGTFGDDAVVFTARSGDGALVGAVLGIVHGTELHIRMTGFDEERTRGSAAYFNLMFYRPFEVESGTPVREVHFGMGSLVTKLHQGAQLRPLWTVLPTGLSPLTRAEVNGRRLAGLTVGVPDNLLPSFTDPVDGSRVRTGGA